MIVEATRVRILDHVSDAPHYEGLAATLIGTSNPPH
jgi:hypothetical protein